MNQPHRRPGVLITTDAYPPDCGGSGWSTHALVRELRGAGFDVEVLEVDAHGDRPVAEREFDGVRLRTIGIGRYRRPARHLVARDYSCEPVRQHVAAFLERRPDIRIVHGQHLHSGPGAALAARAAGRAALVTLRDYWPVRLDGIAYGDEVTTAASPRDLARQALVRSFGMSAPLAAAAAGRALSRLAARQQALAACHRVICVSDAVRRHVRQAIDVPVDVIPNLVDPRRSEEAASRAAQPDAVSAPYLLAAGKLNAMKGFDRIVGELADAGCQWPLVVAGTGPLESEMTRTAARVGIDLVRLGWTDGDTLLRLTREARAVIVPSAWEEPLARVLLEAMSLATPVIARRTGGSPEAVDHGHNGFLFNTAEELGAALRALEDDAVARRLGRAAYDTCSAKYVPAVVLEKLQGSYAQALAETDHE